MGVWAEYKRMVDEDDIRLCSLLKEGYHTDPQLIQLFNEAFKCLPAKVKDWYKGKFKVALISYEKFTFVARVVSDGELNLLILTDDWMRESTKRRTFLLAHEIAHIYLNHHPDPNKDISEYEVEADDLAFKWLGKSYWKVKMHYDKANKILKIVSEGEYIRLLDER